MSGPSLLQELKSIESLFRRQKTVPAEKTLLLYREPGVLGEYRLPGKSWSYYLTSVFQIHNESFNICSHIIAIVLFIHRLLVCLYALDGRKDATAIPFIAFGLCAVAYALFSAAAHTFHSKSPSLHYVGFQLDYAGIGAYGLGIAILIYYSSCPKSVFDMVTINSTNRQNPQADSPGLLRVWLSTNVLFMLVVVPLSWLVMVGCCMAKLMYRRPYPFQRKLWQIGSGLPLSIFISIPLYMRYASCWRDSECSMTSLSHHTVWLCSKLASLLFFSSHLPERWFPGKFDILGQGHQIFHVLVAYTTLKQFDAAYYDVINSYADITVGLYDSMTVMLGTGVYFLGASVIIYVLTPLVRKRVEQDLKRQ